MRNYLLLAILILSIGACSAYTGVGSEAWHTQRLQELQSAYDGGKLSAAEFYKLKNDTDQIYQEYQRPRYVYPSYHLGYGYYYHH